MACNAEVTWFSIDQNQTATLQWFLWCLLMGKFALLQFSSFVITELFFSTYLLAATTITATLCSLTS